MTDSRPRVVLVHGIHAAEGTSNMLRLIDPFNRAGFMVNVFEYGFLSVLGAMFANPYHARALASFLRPGDVAVGHSNGCDLIRRAAKRVNLAGCVYINPALDPGADTEAPWVDVYHNPGDHIVWWSKMIPCHPWGEMGATGYSGWKTNYRNIDCSAMPGLPEVNGHLDLFSKTNIGPWGDLISRFTKQRITYGQQPWV